MKYNHDYTLNDYLVTLNECKYNKLKLYSIQETLFECIKTIQEYIMSNNTLYLKDKYNNAKNTILDYVKKNIINMLNF